MIYVISKINLSGLGPYRGEACCLDGLDKVNYIYGSNGAGKTTISEYLRSDTDNAENRVTWTGGTPSQVIVYNQHYVDAYFQKDDIPGVFTLGEENVEIKKRVEEIQVKLDGLKDKKENYLAVLASEEGKYQSARTAYEESCWALRGKLTDAQKTAFRGHIGKKSAFADYIQSIEVPTGYGEMSETDLEELAQKADRPSLPVLQYLGAADFESMERAESSPSFTKPLVGSGDVEISALISRLNNAGWVESGLSYYKKTDKSVCPFCQQRTSESLAEAIEGYFDAAYHEGKEYLLKATNDYEATLDWCRQLRGLLPSYQQQGIDIAGVANCLIDFDALGSVNLDRMRSKIRDTGRSVELEDTIDVRDNLADAIGKINAEIAVHNEQAEHFDEFKKEVLNKVRVNHAYRLASSVAAYRKAHRSFGKASSNLQSKISQTDEQMESLRLEREELLSHLTSSEPTIRQINSMLADLAFDSFYLTDANEGRDYQIVRPDGSIANRTLSEGERTFITFLYFLSYAKSKASEHPVVVIDDPISSLDSNVLYFVSSMVRDMAGEVRESLGNGISQLLILTHNASFHHEITFPSKGYSLAGSNYYVIRKTARGSMVAPYGSTNPVTTGYEALWRELTDDRQSVSVRNTIRRILETYFSFVGGLNLDEALQQLDPADRSLGRSLLLWVHSGSHILSDDAECSDSGSYLNHYLRVLYRIFESNGQADHFIYMANKSEIALDDIISQKPDAEQIDEPGSKVKVPLPQTPEQ